MDWNCTSCGDFQFGRNTQCRRCGAARPGPSAGSAPPAGRPGDWICPGCQGLVFASKDTCRKCGTSRPTGTSSSAATGIPSSAATGASSSAAVGDWTCPGCKGLVFASKANCWKCGTAKPTHPCASAVPPASGDWTCACGDLVFGSRGSCRRCGVAKPSALASAAAAPSGGRPGDWTCTCGELVFARNSHCHRCGASKRVELSKTVDFPDDWKCPKCQDHQFARNEICRRCGEPRPTWLGAAMGLAPPSYWETMVADGPPWRVVAASPEESEVLKLAMVSGASLGGRDQRSPLTYKGFALHAAWRVQHPGLWGKYAMERENLRKIDLKSLPSVERVKLRQEFVDVASRLPAALDSQLNEVFLSHGTRPESILAILSGGLNERFSGGLFGNGTYLAEDIGKNDQYCTPDKSLGEHKELHKLLFDDTGIQHPGNLCYILVCRALLGCYIRTKDGDRDLDASRSIWSSAQRELALIPDSNPPVLHHSLIAETGGRIARFREFIIYHGARIYPEYLVAYRRV